MNPKDIGFLGNIEVDTAKNNNSSEILSFFDFALLTIRENNIESTETLQIAFVKLQNWTVKWRIKNNENKSVPVEFSY